MSKNTDELLTTKEAAEYWHFKPNTLEKWRSIYGNGPRYIKVNRSVFYRKTALNIFLDERDGHTSTDDYQ